MDEQKSPILRKKKKVQPASSSPDAECICMDSQSFCCPKHNPDDIEYKNTSDEEIIPATQAAWKHGRLMMKWEKVQPMLEKPAQSMILIYVSIWI